MTIKIPDDDFDFEDVVIDKVEPFKSGSGWVISTGITSYAGMPGNSPVVPRPGMVARFYGGARLGSQVYGLTLNGVPIFYETEAHRECVRAILLAGYEHNRQQIALESTLPVPQIPGFEWTEDMRQISGFGGSYERTCRAMVSAGCKWWSEHPEADPKFHGFKGVHGLITEDNDDARMLSKVVTDAAEGACTGAMHQAAVGHVFRWRKLGSWGAYQREIRELARSENI